ncbi:cytosolic phospholipase A2 zeta-like [Carassius carassius]|uniref:cytosolic phospholipase A2 zeta-like n=1 Tax=Carassius carassius TaxID=217509 RepID=UPI002869445F|nr:cytosolic phospholipase A2 zeta-like [Carassius carassius]XP_059374794.1 cytosolic phospholipase A2 zeta-like [Carassius carassius]
MLKKEVKPYWNLSVKILHAKLHQSYDYLSPSDCYVILNLPTASARTNRTKTISNTEKPEWNEVFTFRVHSNIKNILEILIYDEDPLMRDDQIATVLFDINNLTPGKKETKCFIINDKTKDELWVEFEMTKSSETPNPCFSNGVLVAGPFCELNVDIDRLLKRTEATQTFFFKLKGAYKEDFMISNSEESSSFLKTLCYYINRDLETELNLTSETVVSPEIVGTVVVDAAVSDPVDTGLTSIPLKPLPAKQQITVSLPLGENKVDLQLKTDDRSDEELDVRLEFDIPVEEKNFMVKRKKVVSQALQTALNLSSAPEPSKVPVLAVVCSGGGSRALTGTYGSLKGLQKIQLLDAVSYITGVSGATWALGSLYGDPNWSKGGIDKSMESVKKELSKKALSMFSSEQLQEYKQRMEEREKEGLLVSLIDMWGLALEYLFQGKKHMGTLSGMQRTVSEGQNPLPIFTAVNLKNGKKENITDAEWCEFTPFEVGFPKYGAFIPAQNFGSEYYLGHMVKKLPETGLSFLVGMWSSIFSINLTEIWSIATGVTPSWMPWVGGGVSNTETDSKPTALGTYLISPVTDFAKVLCDFMTIRPIVSQVYNFLRGFNLHNSYNENTGFIAWKDTHPDAFPNTMTPADPVLSLVDAGFAVNAGFPPVVHSHRHVDVILSLNYSWEPDQFKVIKQTQEYCADRMIPFPKIDFKKVESEPPKEVYVFEDKENPDVPIVLHFPLVNVSFKQFKSPGVKREGEKEWKEGAVDVEFNSNTSPYLTHKLTYTPEDFQRLINLTSYNIQNNKDVILNALNKTFNRNRQRQTGDDSHAKKKAAAVRKTSSASTPNPRPQKTRKTEAR